MYGRGVAPAISGIRNRFVLGSPLNRSIPEGKALQDWGGPGRSTRGIGSAFALTELDSLWETLLMHYE